MSEKTSDWTFLTKSGINYQGSTFMRKKPEPPKDNLPLLTPDVRYCKRCRKDTRHEKVRDHTTIYWRCSVCVVDKTKKEGIYLPPHLSRHSISSLKERIKK